MSGTDRRSRLLRLAAGAAFLTLAAVLVLIVITAAGSGDGGDTDIEDKGAVAKQLEGIPQRQMTLGDPEAPVELIEFGDLQCPVCAAYSKDVLPEIMETQVRKGTVKIDFRNLTIIGPESGKSSGSSMSR